MLHILHVIHDPFGLDHWQLPLPSLNNIRKEYRGTLVSARKDLDALLSAEQSQGLSIQFDIAEGPPEKRILRVVRH